MAAIATEIVLFGSMGIMLLFAVGVLFDSTPEQRYAAAGRRRERARRRAERREARRLARTMPPARLL